MLTITRRRWEGIVLRDTQSRLIRELTFIKRKEAIVYFHYLITGEPRGLSIRFDSTLHLFNLTIIVKPHDSKVITLSIDAPSYITIIRTELLENRRRLENGCFPYW